jgi:hypothetical protein
MDMDRPRRIWWARPRKLCALERPGGGGRSHRPERKRDEIAYLKSKGVRLVISTMKTRHNLPDYDAAGLAWHHVPVDGCEGADAQLDEILRIIKREYKTAGAIAVHGNRYTDFPAAVCAAYLHQERGRPLEELLAEAEEAGLTVTVEAARLVGADYEPVQPRSRMASATSSGRSVTT